MENVNYASYLADPAVRAAIDSAARRARTEAVRGLAILPLIRLCGALLRVPTFSGARLQAQ